MKIKSFETFLSNCYFQTHQMKSIQKVKIKDNEQIRRLGINCSVLDAPFFKIVWKGGKQEL